MELHATHDGSTRTAERGARSETTEQLVALLRTSDAREHDALRRRLAEANLGVARSVASRYLTRGTPADDVRQVAALALVHACQRFDPDAGHDFLSFCVPTIRGEILRYFRDQDRVVRLPRRIQELRGRIRAAEDTLTPALGRLPTTGDLARHLAVSRAEVADALAAGADRPLSLDSAVVVDSTWSLGDSLGEDDANLGRVEARHMLAPAVRALSDRDRRIILLRFFDGHTQAEIGDLVGVTQMQVSRVLSRILTDLRGRIGAVPS